MRCIVRAVFTSLVIASQREWRKKERKLSNVPCGQARVRPRQDERNSARSPREPKAQRARVRILLVGITVRRALLRDSSGTIQSDAALDIEKTTMVHYARALRDPP